MVFFIKLISLNVPENDLDIIDILIAEQKYPNRSELIRFAIKDFIKKELLLDKAVKKKEGNIKVNFFRSKKII